MSESSSSDARLEELRDQLLQAREEQERLRARLREVRLELELERLFSVAELINHPDPLNG